MKDIKFNVILTAWAKEISPDYKKVLDSVLDPDSGYKIENIIDFGCGKFSAVNYVVKRKKKELAVVDFEELLDLHKFLKERLTDLNAEPLFKQMKYPGQFIDDKSEFDLGLLGNVVPFMPVFLERMLVLSVLNKKIKEKKFLLWYCMTNPHVYRERQKTNQYQIGDGIWLREASAEYQTFYRYHPPDILVFIMYLAGFHFVKRFKVPAVDALLFKRTKFNFLEKLVTPDVITKNIPCQMVVQDKKVVPGSSTPGEINPYPPEFSLYNLVKRILKGIKLGKDAPNPNLFKRLTAGMMQYIFYSQLYNMTLEESQDEGAGFVDCTLQAKMSEGFFRDVDTVHHIKCPVVFIEAKNYAKDINDGCYLQLAGRFDKDRGGQFGFLVCRDKGDEAAVVADCKRYLKFGYILVLDDTDMLKMLKDKIEDNDESINAFLNAKLKRILMG